MIKPSVSVMLGSAECLAEHVDAVLTMWLESTTTDADPDLPRLIGSIITMLNGVPESMGEAKGRLAEDVAHRAMEGKA